jgi:uncharacterized protein YeaO (DUF488 family)
VISIKRIYEKAGAEDGYRVLVDRLWPRGISREKAKIDEWAKGVAPGGELRRWYGHKPELWPEFQRRYRQELATGAAKAELARLRKIAEGGAMTLLTATRNEGENHAVVLKELLE